MNRGQWGYYYLDVPTGTSGIKANLSWSLDSRLNSSLDLFLLSPTSEYYVGETEGRRKSGKKYPH